MVTEIESSLELGAWMGRGEALGAMANRCSMTRAECLRNIRDSESYRLLNLTWDEFCDQHVGLSRPRVDALIQNLEEFGEPYFRLAEMISISPETFRRIAPKIQGETIEVDGEMLPIQPENAIRIRGEVHRLRSRRQKPDRPADQHISLGHNILGLKARLNEIVEEIGRIALIPGQETVVRVAVRDSIRRLDAILQTVSSPSAG
ncbi:MAG TPA: hypothetical protein VE959_12880 [Bryobacteraceae bacterium]|nr:hypothetical protein [Bryobacteraceae bacterium]